MLPLDGVCVLDLSRLLPGGALTQLLGDLGADVVKVERPGGGDDARRAEPTVGESSAVHAFLDRNKRSVALDLKSEEGRHIARRLAAGSDVVVESFRPGVADRLGVGYGDLRQANPAIVYCSVNGYGTGGPRSAAAGHDLDYCAYAGLYDHGGPPAGTPQIGGAQLADVTGGLLGAVGVLAALRRAAATGVGDHIEVALADAALWALGIHVSALLAGGSAGPATAATSGAYPCYQLYRCSDGRHLAVGALEPQFWATLVERIGRGDLLDRQYDPAAIDELAEQFATRPLRAWMDELEDADACVAPVQTFEEAVSDPQFQARGMLVEPEGSVTGRQVGCPIKLASGPVEVRRAPLTVGADDAAVLASLADGR